MFGAEWLRSLGKMPSEYLYTSITAPTRSRRSAGARAARRLPARAAGRLLRARATSARPTRSGPGAPTRAERDRTYMAEARSAAGVERRARLRRREATRGRRWRSSTAVAAGARALRIVNVANRSALPFLDGARRRRGPVRRRGRDGPHPRRRRRRPRSRTARSSQTIKAVERATIDAAVTGSTALAVKAIALHPLVPSVSTARQHLRRLPRTTARAGGRFAWA